MIASFLRRIRSKLLSHPQPEPLFMAENPKYASYKIGRGTYGNPDVRSWRDGTTLKIGSYCSISDSVTIMLGGEHRTDWVTTYPFSDLFPEASGFKGHPHTKGNVVIGHDVWIGYGALILSGVNIGSGAVVAARSVVRSNVEPYSIVAGNPARHVKYRFKESTINALLEIAWWDWPLPRIKTAWPLLLDSDVEKFVAEFSPKTDHEPKHSPPALVHK